MIRALITGNLYGDPQARTIRRCGELLKLIEPGQGARDGKRHDGTVTPLTRTEAATQAGKQYATAKGEGRGP